MTKGSTFSECGKYRYSLQRVWDPSLKVAMCIGLNPSTAGRKNDDGEEEDDATITRLIGTLKALGFGGFHMVNLFAYISSKPDDLNSTPDPLGDNDKWIMATAIMTQEVIFCWGKFRQAIVRGKKMKSLFPDAKCFGKNPDGSPWHPRRMSYIKGFTYDKATLIRYAQ